MTQNTFGKQLKKQTGFNIKVSNATDEATNLSASKFTISRQWTPRIATSASRTFGDFVTQDVKVEYQLNKNISLVGSWETKENTAIQSATIQSQRSDTENILGLDIEYKVEYK